MPNTDLERRRFLAGTALTAATVSLAGSARAGSSGIDEPYAFEVVRSDGEWREMLTRDEYAVLRRGGTELPETSPLWDLFEDGTYCCRGCDLSLYDSVWKVPVDKGWAFFSQSRENAVLMGIDGQPPSGMGDPGPSAAITLIEAHCRRCGSHLGHILTVDNETLHCINGTSLTFRPSSA